MFALKADLGKSLGNLLASCFFKQWIKFILEMAGITRKVATCSIITVYQARLTLKTTLKSTRCLKI